MSLSAEIKNCETCNAHTGHRPKCPVVEIELLQAQVKMFVGVIEGGTQAIDALRIYVSPDAEKVLHGIMSCFDSALSTLPQEFTTQYQKEREVIEAATKLKQALIKSGIDVNAPDTAPEFAELFEALERREGA